MWKINKMQFHLKTICSEVRIKARIDQTPSLSLMPSLNSSGLNPEQDIFESFVMAFKELSIVKSSCGPTDPALPKCISDI